MKVVSKLLLRVPSRAVVSPFHQREAVSADTRSSTTASAEWAARASRLSPAQVWSCPTYRRRPRQEAPRAPVEPHCVEKQGLRVAGQPHPTRSFGRGWPYLGAAVGILSPVLLLKLRSLPSTQGPCLRPTGPRKVGKEGSRRYDLLHLPAHRTTTPTSTSTLHLELHFHTSNPRMPFRDRKDSTYSYVEEDGGPTAAPTLLCSSLHPAHPCASTTPSSVRCTPFEAYRSPSPSQPASAQP